jgi:hypothetical protein
MLELSLVASAGCLLSLVPRLGLVWGRPAGGADAWLFLQYAEALRRTRRFPVRLPQYLLDIEEQWYPPAFPLLLALVPRRALGFASRYLNPLLDSLVGGLVAGVAFAGSRDLGLAAAAAALYATMPGAVVECASLTSRPLANALLGALTMTGALAAARQSMPWTVASIALASLLLLTHKMASQQLVFLAIAAAVGLGSWKPPLILPAAVAGALLVSGGFYGKVWRGHLDILAFWRRNHPWLGAHQVYDSPLFQGTAGARGREYARGTVSPPAERVAKLLYYYGLIGVPVGVDLWRQRGGPLSDSAGLETAILTILFTAAITTLWGPLKFLGEGYKYLRFSAVPASLVLPRLADALASPLARWGSLGGVVGLGLALALRDIGRLRRAPNVALTPDALAAIEFVRGSRASVVLVLPTVMADACAWLSGKAVLWGAHSGGFRRLEPFWPVLRFPIAHFVRAHKVDALLVNEEYVRVEHLGPLGAPFRPAFRAGPIRVLLRTEEPAAP